MKFEKFRYNFKSKYEAMVCKSLLILPRGFCLRNFVCKALQNFFSQLENQHCSHRLNLILIYHYLNYFYF